MRILVTGASGFVGKNLCYFLKKQGHEIISVVRDKTKCLEGFQNYIIGHIDKNTDWKLILKGVDTVFHLAAKAHNNGYRSQHVLEELREINVYSSKKLAYESIDANVKKFIFLSSIGVNGSRTYGIPFSMNDPLNPKTPYAKSKKEAEDVLKLAFKNTHTDLVVIRSPLIYGSDAPGNTKLIMNFIKKNIPLPFGAVSNKRSFIGIDNLISILELCMHNEKAANKVLLVSDGFDLSTKQFINLVGKIIKKKPRIFNLHPKLIEFFLRIVGQKRILDSLMFDLQINSKFLFEDLDWKPVKPLSKDQFIKYLDKKND